MRSPFRVTFRVNIAPLSDRPGNITRYWPFIETGKRSHWNPIGPVDAAAAQQRPGGLLRREYRQSIVSSGFDFVIRSRRSPVPSINNAPRAGERYAFYRLPGTEISETYYKNNQRRRIFQTVVGSQSCRSRNMPKMLKRTTLPLPGRPENPSTSLGFQTSATGEFWRPTASRRWTVKQKNNVNY